MGGNAWWRIGEDMFHEAVGGPWCMERLITRPQRSETTGLMGQRHRIRTGAIVPQQLHRIPSELRR